MAYNSARTTNHSNPNYDVSSSKRDAAAIVPGHKQRISFFSFFFFNLVRSTFSMPLARTKSYLVEKAKPASTSAQSGRILTKCFFPPKHIREVKMVQNARSAERGVFLPGPVAFYRRYISNIVFWGRWVFFSTIRPVERLRISKDGLDRKWKRFCDIFFSR